MSMPTQDQLTTKERFWYEHIQRAEGSKQNLSEYAEAHGLSLKCFYNYRSKLRKKGLLESSQVKSFIQIKPHANEFGTLIVLPNGARIQAQCNVVALSDLIKRLL